MALKYDPEWQAAAAPILTMMAAQPAPADHDVEARRIGIKGAFSALLGPMRPFPDIETTEYKFKSYDGAELSIYRYQKQGAQGTPAPAYIHVHGGGMIAGDVHTFGPAVKYNVSLSRVQAFAATYRLAPEHPHPTPVEDNYAALMWLHEHADELQVDRSRIGIMGESAGGGISAGVSLMARDRNLQPPLAKAILVYPMLDYRNVKPVGELEKFLVWTVSSNLTGWTALLGDKMNTDDVDPYASPTHVKSVEGLPSTYIDTGSLDLFRDEDFEYARRLAAANVDVEFHFYPGVPHGFEPLGLQTSVVQQAMANRVKALKSF